VFKVSKHARSTRCSIAAGSFVNLISKPDNAGGSQAIIRWPVPKLEPDRAPEDVGAWDEPVHPRETPGQRDELPCGCVWLDREQFQVCPARSGFRGRPRVVQRASAARSRA